MNRSIDEVLLGAPTREQRGGGEEEGEGDRFVRQLFESLLLGTRASNSIPDAEGQEARFPYTVKLMQMSVSMLYVVGT